MANKMANKAVASKEKPQTTWNKSVRTGDNEVSVRVEKLVNSGYLVVVEKSGRNKKDDYFCETKKYYSESNPLVEEITQDPFEELANSLSKK